MSKDMAGIYKLLQKNRMNVRYQEASIKILTDDKIQTVADAKKEIRKFKCKKQVSVAWARKFT